MKLDKNGYAPSIVNWHDYEEGMIRHEIYGGTANRRISKENGFWVWLWPAEHRMIHEHPNTGLDRMLKREAQAVYERYYTRDEFRALIGKSYLETPECQPKWGFEPKCGAERMQMWEAM